MAVPSNRPCSPTHVLSFSAGMPSNTNCEDYYLGFESSQRRAVVSQDPVKAHLPSGVRAT